MRCARSASASSASRAPARYGDDLVVTPVWPLQRLDASSTAVRPAPSCGSSPALGGFARGDVTLTAHESALHRPMGAMITALRDVGVDIDDGGHWALPFIVRGHGHVRGGEVVDRRERLEPVRLGPAAGRTPLRRRAFTCVHAGERLPSIPHIDMTIEALGAPRRARRAPRAGEWVVPAGSLRGEGRRDRARSLQRRALPRRGDGRRRRGLGHRLAGALDAARRDAHRDPDAHGRPRRPARRRAHRHRRKRHRRRRPRPLGCR